MTRSPSDTPEVVDWPAASDVLAFARAGAVLTDKPPGGMWRMAGIVATETGILHRMKKDNPEKTFYPANVGAVCEFMKMITLEKVYWSLRDLKYHVTVPPEIAARAKRAIDRMVAIS